MSPTTGERTSARHATRARQPASRSGQRYGNWELLEPVGSGNLCDVYRARWLRADGPAPASYVVKLLRTECENQPSAVACLRREALVGQTVRHLHLIPVLAAHVERPPYFVVLPLLEGSTLKRTFQTHVQAPLPTRLSWARQTAEGLGALHAAGRVHGDVKPANLFVSTQGHVTLFDLGFAYAFAELHGSRRPLFGTARYLAPEVSTERFDVGPASDIYSLGVLLFEALAGRPPWTEGNARRLSELHRTAAAPYLRRYVPHLPREIAQLVRRMLSKQPLRRPTAEEITRSLVDLEIEFFADREPWLTWDLS